MFELSKVTYSQTTKGKDVLVDAHYFEYVLNKVDGITWYWECRYRKKENVVILQYLTGKHQKTV